MGARTTSSPPAEDSAVVGTNEVRLIGRVSQEPLERELPSGDTVWTLRVVVPRPPDDRRRQGVDAIDCAVWSGRLRRSVATWRPGDLVEVSGALRRRFFRSGGAAASRFEVEASAGRVIRRAGTA